MNSFEAAKSIVARLRESGALAYLAGGCVRDRILGLDPKDHDVATDATPQQVCRLFRRTKQVGVQFGVVLVTIDGHNIEVATFRSDGEYLDGRRPEAVEFASAEVDAQRRDFTINGMFYDPFEDRVVDYVGGQKDLAARLIRCIGDPRRRFAEDHLRLLRAVRFAARLGFAIETDTFDAVRAGAPKLADISPERVRMEFEQIMLSATRTRGWQLLVSTGLVGYLVPSAYWTDDQADRVERILSSLPETITLPLAIAAPLHGFTSEAVTTICRDLRCSNQVLKAVRFLTESVTRMIADQLELADVKLLLATQMMSELCVLANAVALADALDTSQVGAVRAQASQIPAEDVAPPPLVTGNDLIALGLSPGPRYAVILEQVYREQLNEKVLSRTDALTLAERLAAAGKTQH